LDVIRRPLWVRDRNVMVLGVFAVLVFLVLRPGWVWGARLDLVGGVSEL